MDYLNWCAPSTAASGLWKLAYERPDRGARTIFVTSSRVESVVRLLAKELQTVGGAILSVDAPQSEEKMLNA
jgi:hypothetical protein